MEPCAHIPDGSDEEGASLVVTIRIAPSGRTLFHDIPAALLPVAAALAPQDRGIQDRLAAAAALAPEPSR